MIKGPSSVGLGRNVVFVTPVLHNGGAERVLSDIANGLVNHGCGVGIISLAHEPDISHLDGRVKICVLHNAEESAKRGGTIFDKIARRIRLLYRLRKALKTIAPDAVVIGFLEPSAQYLWNVRLLGGPPYIVSLHAYESIYFADFYKSRLRRWIEERILGAACRAADWVTVPSEGCSRDLVSHFAVPAAKIRVVQNPVNLAEISRLAGVPFKPVEVASGRSIFVQAARLVKQKNHKLLIEACVQLRAKHDDFIVFCCGEGSERLVLEALIMNAGLENHIRLLGHLNNPYALMAQARGVLLTSEYESFGLVLVEAMICGAPPIATDCNSGPDEVLSDGAGLLVPRNAPMEFADAMLRLIQDDELHDDLRKRGETKAAQYGIDNIVPMWLSLLAEVRI